MHAVGIEGGPGDLGNISAAQVESSFALAMTDHQFTARVQRRQRHDQRAEHPRRLLGVAMLEEKAALVVDQQLVQLGLHPGACAETRGRAFDDAVEHRRPVPAPDANAVGADLPGAAHGGVNQRVCPAAIGRAFSRRDELSGLRRQQRQGDLADAFNLDQRNMQGALASRKEVARRLHGLQDGRERVVDRIHDRFPQTDSVPGAEQVAPVRRDRVGWADTHEPFVTTRGRVGRPCRTSSQRLQSKRPQRNDGGTHGKQRHRRRSPQQSHPNPVQPAW